MSQIKLHYISKRPVGGSVKAIILVDGKQAAEAETNVVFDKRSGKSGFDFLAENLHGKVSWIKVESIRKALDWASCNSNNCQVFVEQ